MGEAHIEIPASAWGGVGDPAPDDTQPCPTCGSKDTAVMSIAQMMFHPTVLDEHTFMIAGHSWGYISCPACEGARPLPAAAPPSFIKQRQTLWHKLRNWLGK